MVEKSLAGKVAVVTGSNSGIGLGVAEALAVPTADLRLFGKPEGYAKRRLGVAVAPRPKVSAARRRLALRASPLRAPGGPSSLGPDVVVDAVLAPPGISATDPLLHGLVERGVLSIPPGRRGCRITRGAAAGADAATAGAAALAAGAVFAAWEAVVAAAPAPPSDTTPSTAPGVTVSPSANLISPSTPSAGATTSRETLSVSSSTSISSFFTGSPAFLVHLAIVASVTDSPRAGVRMSAMSGPARL